MMLPTVNLRFVERRQNQQDFNDVTRVLQQLWMDSKPRMANEEVPQEWRDVPLELDGK